MMTRKIGGMRRGNFSCWDARAHAQDPDKLSPALARWLVEHPEEVASFRWTKPFDPEAVKARFQAGKK